MSEETVNTEGGDEHAALPLVTSRAAGSSDEAPSTSETPLEGVPATGPQQSETPKRHLRKTRVGEVVSNKMDKTIVVAVVRRVPHAKFGKIVKRTKKFYVHDEHNQCAIGDLVRVEETRPLSRLKRWQLVEVLKH